MLAPHLFDNAVDRFALTKPITLDDCAYVFRAMRAAIPAEIKLEVFAHHDVMTVHALGTDGYNPILTRRIVAVAP